MSVFYDDNFLSGLMAIIDVASMTIIDERVYGDNSWAVLMAINNNVIYDNYEAFYKKNCWAGFTAINVESFYDEHWWRLLTITDVNGLGVLWW